MCNVCMMTQTFVPDRHQPGEPVFEGLAALFTQNNAIQETTDAAAGTSTAYSMDAGEIFVGAVDFSNDSDWVKVTMEAGKTYKIDALGTESFGGGTLFDTDLRIYDSTGSLIEYDDLDGRGFDASITYTATTTGTFYIAVDAYSSANTGSYVLEFEDYVPLPPPGTTGTYEELAEFLKSGTNNGTEIKFNTTQSNVITVNISGLEADGQQLALWAMEAWEMVIDVDFQVVTSGEMITVDDEDSGAFAYYPNAGSTAAGVELNVSKAWLDVYGTSIDSYSFQTYVHEFGHAIGLNHLGNYNFDPNGPPITYQNSAYFTNDSWQMSVMSYFDQNENTSTNASYALLSTTMMADIIAAQHFYGAADENSATAGDTIFGHGSNLGNYMDEVFNSIVSGNNTSNTNGQMMAYTLFDQGGTDLFDLSPYTQNLNIDLNDGAFSDVGNFISVIAIAVDTIIENLKLGSGNDTAIGNEADNTIEGGGGNDTITGNAGDDIIDGGTGTDTGVLTGPITNFRVFSYGDAAGTIDFFGGEGVDYFTSIESLQFGSTTFSAGIFEQFEAMRYLASNLDLVPQLGLDGSAAFEHFMTQGYDGGRQITFNAIEYIASYAPLIEIFGTDTEAASRHYIEYGINAGWAPDFRAFEYIASYSELIDTYGLDTQGAMIHYIQQGYNGGLQTTFSGLEYIASYDILIDILGTDAEAGARHYIEYGRDVGWAPTFQSYQYIASHASLIDTLGADAEAGARHFIETGRDAGWTTTFSGIQYIASYIPLIQIFGADAEAGAKHYIEYGRDVGWAPTFESYQYIASYEILIDILGADADAGAQHYVEHGFNAGWEVSFNGLEYIASYAPLIQILGADAEAGAKHYIEYGRDVGWEITFSGLNYLAAHNDLLTILGGDGDAATLHYITSGVNEGRITEDRGGRSDLTDSQTGTSDSDTLTGGNASELLAGMGGTDTLSGGGGDDVLVGGGGADTFIFVDNFGDDIITDFNALNDNEQIDLSGVTGITDYTDLVDNHLTTINGVVTITDGADSIALNGVNINDLDMEDFIFV